MRLNFTNADWKDIVSFENIYDDTDELADDELIGVELNGFFDDVLIKGGYFKNQKELYDYRKDDSNGGFIVEAYLKKGFKGLVLRVIPYNEDEFEPKEFELYGEGADKLENDIISIMPKDWGDDDF